MADTNKRLTTPGAYGTPASGAGQLLKTKDQFAQAREAGDTGAQLGLIDKARSQAVNNEAQRVAAEEKAAMDAQAQAGVGQQPMGPQFYRPRRRR